MRPESGIDRNPQNLPIPMGGYAPVWKFKRAPKRSRRIQLWVPRGIAVLGLCCAALGASLALRQNDATIYWDSAANVIYVNGTALLSVGTGTYGGGAVPAFAIVANGDGTEVAAAQAKYGPNQLAMAGSCRMTAVTNGASVQESCTFSLGGQTLQAADRYDLTSHVWHRTYLDGQTIDISTAKGAIVPVPFPFGR